MKRCIFHLLNISLLCFAGGNAAAQCSTTYTYSSPGGVQTYTVPAGITTIAVDLRGGAGGTSIGIGSTGGLGGRVTANLAVTPAEVLYIYVGGAGANGSGSGAGGYNGGGNLGPGDGFPAGGGGASDIRTGGTAYTNRIIIAGGGGGGVIEGGGGAGGGLTGATAGGGGGGGGGTQSAGGSGGAGYPTAAGTLGIGGNGGPEGAGGGGGYYGGGGGIAYGGGGGGSSYPASGLSSLSHTQGYNSGNGSVIISLSSYAITTSAVSHGSISPSGTTSVCSGSDQGYTITPNSGYYISSVLVDGSGVGAVSSYTFSSVSAAHTIGASFTLNTAPIFTGGSPQSLAVCKNSGAADISSLLQITDPDAGQTETFSVTSGPSHGTITTGTTVTSGTSVSPTGWSYTPTGGYSGSDAFTIQASDGAGGTASTVINVTVNAPTVSISGTPAPICQGGTTAAGLGGSVGGSATGGSWTDGGSGGTFYPDATTLNATYTASASFVSPVMLKLTTTGGSCGTIFTTKSLIVNHNPTVTISGTPAAICQGSTTATGLGGSVTGGGATGGTWSDGGADGTFNPGPTTLNATYTASATAPSTVTLTLTGIATCPVSHAISLTVNPYPTTVGTITGTATLDNGVTTTLADAPTSGTWSSANTAIASVDPSSGVVTGGAVGGGNTIYYTVSNSCGTAKASYVIHVYSSVCNCY